MAFQSCHEFWNALVVHNKCLWCFHQSVEILKSVLICHHHLIAHGRFDKWIPTKINPLGGLLHDTHQHYMPRIIYVFLLVTGFQFLIWDLGFSVQLSITLPAYLLLSCTIKFTTFLLKIIKWYQEYYTGSYRPFVSVNTSFYCLSNQFAVPFQKLITV